MVPDKFTYPISNVHKQFSSMDEAHNAELSSHEVTWPLSPVLGSGKSKQLLKNRNRHRKLPRKCNSTLSFQQDLSNTIEDENGSKNECNIPAKLQVTETTSHFLTNKKQETVVDRINRLEALELERHQLIKSISFNSLIPNDLPSNPTVDYTFPITVETLPPQEPEDFQTNISNNAENMHFQTGSGKSIAISKPQIEISKKLFDDILHNTSLGVSRDNKYNYLHSSQNTSNNSKIDKNISETEDVCFKEPSLNVDGTSQPNPNRDCLPCQNPQYIPNANISATAEQLKLTNVFEGENFEDLKLDCQNGFQAASLHFKTSSLVKQQMTNPEVYEESILALKQEVKPIKESEYPQVSKNIFKGENFDDLSCQLVGFKTPNANLIAIKPKQFAKPHYNQGSKDQNFQSKTEESFKRANLQQNCLKMPCVNGQNESCNPIKFHHKTGHVKNIFEGEAFDDLNMHEAVGFKSASLISFNSIKSEENIDMLVQSKSSVISNKTYFNKRENLTTTNQTENPLKTDQTKEKGYKNIFEDENFDDLNVQGTSFKTSAVHKRTDNYQSMQKPILGQVKKPFKNIFEGECFDDLDLSGVGFTTKRFIPPTRSLKNCGDFRSPLKTILEDTSESTTINDFKGFSLLEQRTTLDISNSGRQLIQIIDEEIQLRKNINHKSLLSIKNIINVAETMNNTKQKLNLNNNISISRKRKISDIDPDSSISSLNYTSSTPQHTSFIRRPRKRLGCFVSPTIQVSQTGVKRAKLTFEDLEPATFSTSTPLKLENLAKPLNSCLTPVPSVRKKLDDTFSSNVSKGALNLSKTIHKSSTFNSTIAATNNNRFSLSKPAEPDVRVWLENLNKERMLLEEQLRIVNEKQTILCNQRTILDSSSRAKIRPKPGILYKSKRKPNRVRLQEYVQYSEPGNQASAIGFLDQINPQNAHLMHFTVSDKRISHVTTEDGAVIIPNIDSKIGISEIEHSFKLLEGVDIKLIPKNWIGNHYKWVIWKLASYERMFPDKFDGCLSLENVMQQLKYRYDVEIDNAQRSVLRRIFEKDDCSQRRMVLCVSKVVKVNDTYELELSDGWYPIRTCIDLPLCNQIIKGKIKIGNKLIVYGAELMNCEGCHPLEAPVSVHLKISYNSTRRALWWCKLGSQRQSGPFVIPMSSINMIGGKIGCLKCFILRVYPVKYMEKCENKKVWRNRKAEERCEQNFYNDKFKLESLQHKSRLNTDNGIKTMSYNDVRNIEDPEVLYDILQSSHDPENIQEMLSSAQKTSLYNYCLNKTTDMPSQWSRHKKIQRNVKSMLKIKIVDACYNSEKIYDFQVWSPTENHLNELKEGEFVTIFNVSCSLVWGLNASQNTQFRRECRSKDTRFERFDRKVTHIKDMATFRNKDILFNEFDTVGIVIKKQINVHDQQVWIADREQRLLLINICDSPKNILVLDMVNEGQIVSVCNLTFQSYLETHSFAVANHFVVFARYSQYRHLQEALAILEEEFKNIDRDSFILSCTNKIMQIELKGNKTCMDLDDMECSQITTTDIALLECLEKLA